MVSLELSPRHMRLTSYDQGRYTGAIQLDRLEYEELGREVDESNQEGRLAHLVHADHQL